MPENAPQTFRIFIVWTTFRRSFADGRPPELNGRAALWLLDGTKDDLPAAEAYCAAQPRLSTVCGERSVYCTSTAWEAGAKREAELWALHLKNPQRVFCGEMCFEGYVADRQHGVIYPPVSVDGAPPIGHDEACAKLRTCPYCGTFVKPGQGFIPPV